MHRICICCRNQSQTININLTAAIAQNQRYHFVLKLKTMIKYSETTDSTIIEREVCKKMDSLQRHEMDKENTEILMRLYLAKNFSIPDKEKPFLFQVIEKRLQHCFSYKIEDHRLILFLCALAESPGSAIMYLWYLQYWCFINEVKELDLELFCKKIFPTGFFSKSDLSIIWNAQKVSSTREENGSDNLIDYASAGMSIQFEVIQA